MIHFTLSVLTVVLGILLMAFMVHAENEPGAVPLGLVLIGTSWFFLTYFRKRSQQK